MVYFCDWFILLNISYRSIHIVADDRISLLLILGNNSLSMHTPDFACPFIHFSCHLYIATVDGTVMNRGIQVSIQKPAFHSFNPPHCFLQQLCHFTFPPKVLKILVSVFFRVHFIYLFIYLFTYLLKL